MLTRVSRRNIRSEVILSDKRKMEILARRVKEYKKEAWSKKCGETTKKVQAL